MKVGVNARTFMVDEPDGAVQTARKLTRQLSDHDNIDLTLFGDSQLEADFDEVSHIQSDGFMSNSPFFGVIWERTILPFLVKREDLDVLLCPNGNAPLTSVGCPIVTYIHDVNAQKGMSSGVHRAYRKIAIPLGVQNSDTIVTVSEFSRDEIVTHLPVSSEDVCVIYNGVDDFYLKGDGSEPMELPEQYILYVGAMNPRKNVRRLVESYERIQDDIPHKLVLIGPQNKSVYQKMDVESFSDKLVTPGFIPREQLKYAYENADVFVYPSLYEGFGLPPLEAMACGTRVIASDVSSIPEVLDGLGRLVDPTDSTALEQALVETLSSKPHDEPTEKLQMHARGFTWEKASESLVQVLRNTIGES